MFCNNCNNEIENSKLCPFCGAELYFDTCENNWDWRVVYTTNNLIEAEYLQSSLEDMKIPVQILSQQDSTRMFTIGDLSIIKLFTPLMYSEEAKTLIFELLKNFTEEIYG